MFQDAGLIIGLVTAPTNLNDPDSTAARALFEACGKAGVPAVKVGYLGYQPGNAGHVQTDARVGQAVIQQVPFTILAPTCQATRDVEALASCLIGPIGGKFT